MTSGSRRVVTLTGEDLTPSALMSATEDTVVEVSKSAWTRIREGRAALMRAVREHATVYGVNTGFGSLANTVIPHEKLAKLQRNLIRSHAAGACLPLPRKHARSGVVSWACAAWHGRAIPSRKPCKGE